MKKSIYCFILFFLISINSFSQQLKNYKGTYAPAYPHYNRVYEVDYNFYEDKDLNRIYHGNYSLIEKELVYFNTVGTGYYFINGNFKNNLPIGEWTLSTKGLTPNCYAPIYDKGFIKGYFSDGLRNGIWETSKGLKVKFINDSIVGNIKYNGLNINIREFRISGHYKNLSNDIETEVRYFKGYQYYTLKRFIHNGEIIKKVFLDTNIVNSCITNFIPDSNEYSITYYKDLSVKYFDALPNKVFVNKKKSYDVVGYAEHNGKYYKITFYTSKSLLSDVIELGEAFNFEKGITKLKIPTFYGIEEDSTYKIVLETEKINSKQKRLDSINKIAAALFNNLFSSGDRNYQNNHLNEALKYYQEALSIKSTSELETKISDVKSKINYYNLLITQGDSLKYIHNYNKSIDCYIKAKNINNCEEIIAKLDLCKKEQEVYLEQRRNTLSDSLKQLVLASLKLVYIEGGEYKSNCDKHLPSVSLKGFKISAYEITNYQFILFKLVMNKYVVFDTSNYKMDLSSLNRNLPATTTYDEAVAFCKWIDADLPTENEWEYVASGGAKPKKFIYSGSNSIESVANYYSSGGRYSNVGSFKPNTLGIYDMSGNIGEYIKDSSRYTKGGTVLSLIKEDFFTICTKNNSGLPNGFRIVIR